MDPWLKLMLRKHLKIRIWIFLCVFCVSKCRLSPSVGIVISKIVFFVISLIVTKLSISYLRCFIMDPWLKLKFWKHPKIRIWNFFCVIRVSKCWLSPRIGIVISKFVFFEISLIVTKLSISWLKCSTMDPRLQLKFWKHLEIKIWILVCI